MSELSVEEKEKAAYNATPRHIVPGPGPTSMDNDRWNHFDQLLQSALDVPVAERDAYLRHELPSRSPPWRAGGAASAVPISQPHLRPTHPGGVGFIQRFGALYPIYVRGVAYLAARQPSEAAAEFQRIVDHRSIVFVDPMDGMARLQLARALVLVGDTAKAMAAYSDLLALWKDADPGIPAVEQARGEYARLL